jgi:hypothetical protein
MNGSLEAVVNRKEDFWSYVVSSPGRNQQKPRLGSLLMRTYALVVCVCKEYTGN